MHLALLAVLLFSSLIAHSLECQRSPVLDGQTSNSNPEYFFNRIDQWIKQYENDHPDELKAALENTSPLSPKIRKMLSRKYVKPFFAQTWEKGLSQTLDNLSKSDIFQLKAADFSYVIIQFKETYDYLLLNTFRCKPKSFKKKLLNILQTFNLPTAYIDKSFSKIDWIVVGNNEIKTGETSALFFQLDTMLLERHFFELKNSTVSGLKNDQLASFSKVIYHEFWHLYFKTLKDKSCPKHYRKLLRIARANYPDIPSINQEETMNEGIAAFVEIVLDNYLTLNRSIRNLRNSSGDISKHIDFISLNYNKTFKEPAFSYFHKTISTNLDEITQVQIDLGPELRDFVFTHLFEGKVPTFMTNQEVHDRLQRLDGR